MQYTEHIKRRMVDRNISDVMIDLILKNGYDMNEDRIMLGKKELFEISKSLKKIVKDVDTSIKKGGLTLVNREDSLITVFHNYEGKNERKQKWKKNEYK